VKCHSPMAIQYSDRSILEHHHLAQTFQLLTEPRYSFIGLSKEDFFEARAIIIDIVLHTDLATHFEFVSKIKLLANTHGQKAHAAIKDASFSRRGPAPNGPTPRVGRDGKVLDPEKLAALAATEWKSPFSDEATTDMNMIFITAIKFADLGHVCKLLDQHEHWSTLISEEMWKMGDKEKSLGVPISPLCDRNADHFIPISQVGFFKYICKPFFSTVFDLVGPSLVDPADRFYANQKHWEHLVASRPETPRHCPETSSTASSGSNSAKGDNSPASTAPLSGAPAVSVS